MLTPPSIVRSQPISPAKALETIQRAGPVKIHPIDILRKAMPAIFTVGGCCTAIGCMFLIGLWTGYRIDNGLHKNFGQ